MKWLAPKRDYKRLVSSALERMHMILCSRAKQPILEGVIFAPSLMPELEPTSIRSSS